MKMNSLSFGKIDTDNFDELYYYLVHVSKTVKIKMLIVSPRYYAKILKHPLWYQVRLAKSLKTGFNIIELGTQRIKILVSSIMIGDFCVI